MIEYTDYEIKYPFTDTTFDVFQFKAHIELGKESFKQWVLNNYQFDMRKFSKLWNSMVEVYRNVKIPTKPIKHKIIRLFDNKERMKLGIHTIEQNSRIGFITLNKATREHKNDIVNRLQRSFNNVNDRTYINEDNQIFGFIIIS